MEKIKHIPLFLFAITASKLLILGSDWASALTLLILAGTAAFWEFKVQDKVAQGMRPGNVGRS